MGYASPAHHECGCRHLGQWNHGDQRHRICGQFPGRHHSGGPCRQCCERSDQWALRRQFFILGQHLAAHDRCGSRDLGQRQHRNQRLRLRRQLPRRDFDFRFGRQRWRAGLEQRQLRHEHRLLDQSHHRSSQFRRRDLEQWQHGNHRPRLSSQFPHRSSHPGQCGQWRSQLLRSKRWQLPCPGGLIRQPLATHDQFGVCQPG